MAGQIIIVNGTSGSGKTTACDLFSKQAADFWLTFGIDQFLGSAFPRAFGHGGERCREGFYAHPVDKSSPDGDLRWSITKQGMNAFAVFHEWVAAASRGGCNIIVDHFLLSDPPLLQDCIWRLKDLPVLLVTLKPAYDDLVTRIENREIGKRFSNSSYNSEQARQSRERLTRLSPWFYREVYKNRECDLELDTIALEPEQVCENISQRLNQGAGIAFDTLRKTYAKPDSIPPGDHV